MTQLSIKQKLIIFSFVILSLIAVAAFMMIKTLDEIDTRFHQYKNFAVDGKIATLKISRDLNYISRSTRNIMLGATYDENYQKILNRKQQIVNNFDLLTQTMINTPNEKSKIKLVKQSKKMTLAFINDAIAKMKLAKDIPADQRYELYNQYATQATPLANKSRHYFGQIHTLKEKGFEVLSSAYETEIQDQRNLVAVSAIIIGLFIAIFMKVAFENILKHLKTQENLDKTQKLLQQYKNAIDITNIVSKTDPRGIITYVNNEFCKASQYDKDELLHQPHNIVRHPNTKKETFKELWTTIKNHKPWNGIIKNRKKDGTSYYVDTTILPIVGHNDKIEEYIAIRKDVTELIELNMELQDSQKEILNRIGMIAETRSEETGNHVKRVAEYSKILGQAYGMSKKEVELLYSATALHDIGKVAIADGILHKPGKLSKEEFDEMKKHTTVGFDMLRGSSNDIILAGATIAHEHHEKYNGTGYPRGIAGEEIHIFARITAIADVFDALGGARIYKKAWDLPDILDLIKEERGKHFDPELVDLFFDNLEKILFIRKKLKSD